MNEQSINETPTIEPADAPPLTAVLCAKLGGYAALFGETDGAWAHIRIIDADGNDVVLTARQSLSLGAFIEDHTDTLIDQAIAAGEAHVDEMDLVELEPGVMIDRATGELFEATTDGGDVPDISPVPDNATASDGSNAVSA